MFFYDLWFCLHHNDPCAVSSPHLPLNEKAVPLPLCVPIMPLRLSSRNLALIGGQKCCKSNFLYEGQSLPLNDCVFCFGAGKVCSTLGC